MKTTLNLPTKNLLMPKTIELDLDISAEQHDDLLVASSHFFERAMVEVVNQNTDIDAYQLPFVSITALFMLMRQHSLGGHLDVPWSCNKMVERTVDGKRIRSECSTQNHFVTSVGQLNYKELDEKKTEYEKFRVKDPDSEDDIVIYNRYLSAREEFDVFDYFYETKKISKEQLFGDEKNIFEFFKRRWLTSLEIENEKYKSVMLPEEKAQFIKEKKVPASVVGKMYSAMRELDAIGYDLSPVDVTCKGCGGVSRLRLPLQAGLVVS